MYPIRTGKKPGVSAANCFRAETTELFRRVVAILVFICCLSTAAAVFTALYQPYATVFVEQPQITSIPPDIVFSEYADKNALIPIHIGMGIFYDGESRRILMPSNQPAGILSNYAYSLHTIEMDMEHDTHIIIQDGLTDEIIWQGFQLTIHTAVPLFVELSETCLQFVDPKTRYASIVVIDPGHGGEDPGALGKNLHEKNINLEIVLTLLDIFDREDIWLLPTRTEDIFISKDDRHLLANAAGDYFISVHINADARSKRSHGTETYYFSLENEEPITGKAFAQIVQGELISRLGSRDRGIIEAFEYNVLANTNVPAVMAEVLFLSNLEEEARLADPETILAIAEALKSAIEQLPLVR